MILKLAMRNLMGAGIRTWLNALVLSLCFVIIIWAQGLYDGMTRQVSDVRIRLEIGGGQYWHPHYDAYDPFSLQDAHAKLPRQLRYLVEKSRATPILIRPGAIYPDGHMQSVLLKGVDPEQMILEFPSKFLVAESGQAPAMIGGRMAESTGLKEGDDVMIRWRDVNGTFDAKEVTIVRIMQTDVQSIDVGQIWLPLDELQAMAAIPDQATLVVVDQKEQRSLEPSWPFFDQDYLLRDLHQLVKAKSMGSIVFYAILLSLALLAIFNTQVLSIFRRRKEIGTLIALGMRRRQVVHLFTLEGGLHGVLAGLMGAIYGIPLLAWTAMEGLPMPEGTEGFGFAIGQSLYPVYSVKLIVVTTLFILLAATLVSYLPSRSIARWNPTQALKGNIS